MEHPQAKGRPDEGSGELHQQPAGESTAGGTDEGGLADLLPWRTPDDRTRGLRREAKVVKERGGRVHPRSGAGRIKNDGSTQEADIEVKSTNGKQFILKAEELRKSWVQAVRAGKEQMVWVIVFEKEGVEAEVTVRLRPKE